MTRVAGAKLLSALDPRGLAIYALDLVVVGITYFGLANVSLTVAAIYSSAIPLWAPAGLGFAAVLLRGIRVWPAIFAAAYAAGVPTDLVGASAADSIMMSLAVAAGATLAPVVGGYLINIWAHGRKTFDTPTGVTKFALIVLGATMTSATAGVAGLVFGGYLESADVIATWSTWWLRDAAGVLVVAPVIVLWALGDFRPFSLRKIGASAGVFVVAGVVGALAFSPLIEQSVPRSALAFLAVLPLVWAALRCGPRDTATTALILAGFAAWGILAGSGPFAAATFTESFLLFVAFTVGLSVASSGGEHGRGRAAPPGSQVAPAGAISPQYVQPGDHGHCPDRHGRTVQPGQQSVLRNPSAPGAAAAADADRGSRRTGGCALSA